MLPTDKKNMIFVMSNIEYFLQSILKFVKSNKIIQEFLKEFNVKF